MFDFSKIEMIPSYGTDFEPAATDAQIEELEQHCGHTLPKNYKTILKNYNGGQPKAKYFNVMNEELGIPGEWKLYNFYFLNENKTSPANIWWLIENYIEYMGPNTLPFADDGDDQVFYIKWINNVPQVWFLAYLDLEEPETYLVVDSFDKLLGALYAID